MSAPDFATRLARVIPTAPLPGMRELTYVPVDPSGHELHAPRSAPARRRAHRLAAEELPGARVDATSNLLTIHGSHPAHAAVGRLRLGDALDITPEHIGRLLHRAWWRPAPRNRPRVDLAIDPARIRFVDLETTGLSGGTGTLPFLIGVGGWGDDGRFFTEQLLLRSPAEEPRALARLGTLLADASAVCSFNGKSFDLPMLRTRHVMTRRRLAPALTDAAPQVDLLHPARRMYKRWVPSCRLAALEVSILGRPRSDDTPGWMAPAIYGAYLRSGDASELAGIVAHNRDDLLGMVGLLAALTRALAESL